MKSPEGEKQAERDAQPGFRAGVVGSNPAGPTISEKIHALSTKISFKIGLILVQGGGILTPIYR
jgi:hypothetical protein